MPHHRYNGPQKLCQILVRGVNPEIQKPQIQGTDTQYDLGAAISRVPYDPAPVSEESNSATSTGVAGANDAIVRVNSVSRKRTSDSIVQAWHANTARLQWPQVRGETAREGQYDPT